MREFNTMADSSFHLVIPCFRESGRIPTFLETLRVAFADDPSVSVLVVDDGSGDYEADLMRAIVENARKTWPGLRPLLSLPNNLGKGGAVYAGWRTNSTASWLGFVDADGSVPAYEVKRLLESVRATVLSADAVIASRILMLGKNVRRHFHRHVLGRVFATLVSELLNIPVYDSQCGLKVISSKAFQAVESKLGTFGFAFDVDLLVALLDSGFRVREEPVDWAEVPGGKVRILRDSWSMLIEILRIKRRRSSMTRM